MPRRKVDVKKEIILALNRLEKATWPELLEKTGVSKGALSTYLTKMIKWGIVVTDVDASVRPPVTVYQFQTTKIGQAIKYALRPFKDKMYEFERLLQDVKELDENTRQEAFDKIFASIVFNLLADHLACFEAALEAHKHTGSKQEAVEFYSYFWHTSFVEDAKAIFEFLISEPEYEELFSNSVNEVIWITEKIHPKRQKNYDIQRALRELTTRLRVEKK